MPARASWSTLRDVVPCLRHAQAGVLALPLRCLTAPGSPCVAMNCDVCRSPRKMVDTVLSTRPSPIRPPLPSTSVLDPATRNASHLHGLQPAEAVAQLGCLPDRSKLIAAASSPRGSCTMRRWSISRSLSSAFRLAWAAAACSSAATSRSKRRRFSSARCWSRASFSCFATRAARLRACISLARCLAAAWALSRALSARATEA